MPGTFPRWIHHQNPPRRRRAMPAPGRRPDTRTLRRQPAVRAGTHRGVGASYRSRTASHPARPHPGGQGLHVPKESPLPASTRHPPHHHPRTPRSAKAPGEPRVARWSAHWLRQRALQEAQHRRRAINRLKGFRAVATRYENRAYNYLGTVILAALAIWLRTDPRNSA